MSSVVSEELITFERIPAGYLIGKVMFIASLGLDYLYMLWQNPGKRISCAVLENGDKLTDGEAEDLKGLKTLAASGTSSTHSLAVALQGAHVLRIRPDKGQTFSIH